MGAHRHIECMMVMLLIVLVSRQGFRFSPSGSKAKVRSKNPHAQACESFPRAKRIALATHLRRRVYAIGVTLSELPRRKSVEKTRLAVVQNALVFCPIDCASEG